MEMLKEVLEKMSEFLIGKFPIVGTILAGLGLLLMIAQMVVLFTPTKKDDELLENLKSKGWFKLLFNFFLSFAPFQKGQSGLQLSNKKLE